MRSQLRALGRSYAARVFCAVFLVYAFYAQDGWNANSNRYDALAHAIVLEHRLEITTWHETSVDVSYANGGYYAGAAPGPAFVLVPFYAVFHAAYPLLPERLRARVQHAVEAKLATQPAGLPRTFDPTEFALSEQALTLIVPPAAGAALATLLFVFFRRRVEERDAVCLALLAAFGTIVFYYSTVFFSHVLAALCAFGSFLLLDDATRSDRPIGAPKRALSPRGAYAAGALAGFATTMDYLAVSASVVLAVLALTRLPWKSRFLLFVAGALTVAALLALYQKLAFGSVLLTPYSFPAGPEAAGSHDVLNVGFFGMDRPRPAVLLQLTLGPRRGYFVHMPLLLIGVGGLFAALTGRPGGPCGPAVSRGLAAAALSVLAALLLFNASMKAEAFWLSGISFGPRYLIPSIPFAATGLVVAWQQGPRVRLAILASGALSIVVNWLGAQIGASERPSPFPIFDRFLSSFLAEGPQSNLVNNLRAVTGASRGAALAVELVGMAIVAAAVFGLLRRAPKSPAAL